MIWRRRTVSAEPELGTFYVTCRMQTGAARFRAHSERDLAAMIEDLREAGATDITVVDEQGRLVTFDLGKGAQD